ncbi:MAG: sulfatase family protein [Verrucomicrobiota bacterium]
MSLTPKMLRSCLSFAGLILALQACTSHAAGPQTPNIILIYGDDIGYGDLGCYGATAVKTPNVDRVAAQGLRFVNGYCTSSTCTPSRYSLLTGEYAFRQKGTHVLPGSAALIIQPGRTTLPALLQRAGYRTGIVGKWHLGLGTGDLDWNGLIAPGPLEVGFDYGFIMPATADRVPCVYVENHRVVGLDPADPLEVSYQRPFPGERTAASTRNSLRMNWSNEGHPHDQALVNGIGRIGYMKGGRSALWKDETLAETFTQKALAFIQREKDHPFFLYLAATDIHVPRVPNSRFAGLTTMGPRGDAIAEFDACVGSVLKKLDALRLNEKTLLIISSDNGPVLDDGYQDGAVEKLGNHKPAGPFRGGKYSVWEGGTRIPLIVYWPGRVRPGVSDAFVSQFDFCASFAALVGQPLEIHAMPDSQNVLAALLGDSPRGRDHIVEYGEQVALREGHWKFIPPLAKGKADEKRGTSLTPALYDLAGDPGETKNLAAQYPQRMRKMSIRLEKIRGAKPASPQAAD